MSENILTPINGSGHNAWGVVKKALATRCDGWVLAIKKTQRHPKADVGARQRFTSRIESYQNAGHTLIYIDESGFNQHMPRTHGYALTGQRCVGVHDWQDKRRVNVIGAICNQRLLSVSLFEQTINADTFLAWLREDLLPQLPPASVLIMDNAAFHKRADIQALIKDHEHILEYLPPYSPDLNPIEHKWAQAKAYRRREYCSVEAIFVQAHI